MSWTEELSDGRYLQVGDCEPWSTMSREAVRTAALGVMRAVGRHGDGLTLLTLGSLCNIVFCIMTGGLADSRALFAVAETIDPRAGTAAWRPASDAEMRTVDESMTAWATTAGDLLQ